MRKSFPKDFLFGTATSAYQIEGAVREDGRGPSIWDTFSHTPGRIKEGHTADLACDHYHRYLEDIALMANLGVDAYRFSVAWPRILPHGWGHPNPRGLDFYDRLVDALLEHGIEPFVTLYHWDLPQALEEKGGWGNRETAQAFAEYAQVVAGRLKDRVRRFITLNEPWVTAFLGHFFGLHAPGHRSLDLALRAVHHQTLAHLLAARALREMGLEVGLTVDLTWVEAASPLDEGAKGEFEAYRNRLFLDPIYHKQYPEALQSVFPWLFQDEVQGDLDRLALPPDFLGVNYYTRTLVRQSSKTQTPLEAQPLPPRGPTTAMGWEVYPQGLREVLLWVHKEYGAGRIYVTENGAAYEDRLEGGRISDPERKAYLEGHIQAVLEAIQMGAPVKGYFVWSLLDNFEWIEGYTKRFGIVYVDFSTQRRILKESGRWYRNFIEKS